MTIKNGSGGREDAEGQRLRPRAEGRRFRIVAIVIGLAASVEIFNLARLHPSPSPGPGANDVPLAVGRPGRARSGSGVCEGVWGYLYDKSDVDHGGGYLDRLRDECERYHDLGGGAKAYSRFLDSALDQTYNTLGLNPFVPDKEGGELKGSVVDYIRGELRRRDKDGRGGYYQRSMPGRFQRPNGEKNYKELFQNGRSITSVLEPVTHERFDIAMGPRLEERSCRGFHEFGGAEGMDRKYICGWDVFSKGTSNGIASNGSADGSCNVISIGSNDQWGFEEYILENTDCVVHTFDCTIKRPKKKPRSDRVHFHSICIAGQKKEGGNSTGTADIDGKSYGTYFELIEAAGLLGAESNRPPEISYLKMDVEGYEWEVFSNMVHEAKVRDMTEALPRQIQTEVHFATWMYDLPWAMRTLQTGEMMPLFGMMFRAGYVVAHVDDPMWPPLREVLMLRLFC